MERTSDACFLGSNRQASACNSLHIDDSREGDGLRDAEPEQAHLAFAAILCWARTRPLVGGASAVMMRDNIMSCMGQMSTCDLASASEAPDK